MSSVCCMQTNLTINYIKKMWHWQKWTATCKRKKLGHFVTLYAIIDSMWIQDQNMRGTWVAQLIKLPTSAQVMISCSVSLSPTLGSVLPAQSLEPALDSVSLSLSPSSACALSLSLRNKC